MSKQSANRADRQLATTGQGLHDRARFCSPSSMGLVRKWKQTEGLLQNPEVPGFQGKMHLIDHWAEDNVYSQNNLVTFKAWHFWQIFLKIK